MMILFMVMSLLVRMLLFVSFYRMNWSKMPYFLLGIRGKNGLFTLISCLSEESSFKCLFVA